MKTIGTCKECKYYDDTDCSNGYFIDCSGSTTKIEGSFLFYRDYEGYRADLKVGEDFGCIHWEEKK